MSTRKSVSNMKVMKPENKKKKITKDEYLNSGKFYQGNVRQLSIKEVYAEIIKKDIKAYSSAYEYVNICELLKVLAQVEYANYYEVKDIMQLAVDYLNEIDKFTKDMTVEQLEVVDECLPDGTRRPTFKKNWFESDYLQKKYYSFFNLQDKNLNYINIAKGKVIDDIKKRYEGMLLQDALKLSMCDD